MESHHNFLDFRIACRPQRHHHRHERCGLTLEMKFSGECKLGIAFRGRHGRYSRHNFRFEKAPARMVCGRSSNASLCPSLGLLPDGAAGAVVTHFGTPSPTRRHQAFWSDQSGFVAPFDLAGFSPDAETDARIPPALREHRIVLGADVLLTPKGAMEMCYSRVFGLIPTICHRRIASKMLQVGRINECYRDLD